MVLPMIRLFVLLTIIGAIGLHVPHAVAEEKKAKEGEEEVACVEEPADGEAKKEEGGKHDEKGPPPCPKGPQYVSVGILNVPVLKGDKIAQQVTIEIVLET